LRCRAAGIDAYLSKPVRLPLLKSTIEKWLGPAGDTLPETQPSLQAPVSESPPADLRVLVALVGDSKAVIEEVLHAFRASACQSHEEIKRGCADGSSSLVSDAAHKLKSAARSIGAARLGDICAEIETVSTAGQSGNLLPLLLPSFEAEIHRLFIFLDSR
jgi:two-component system sensor histidine kinase/response regulator